MPENRIEIIFAAVIDKLQAGVNKAVSEVHTSTAKISASVNTMAAQTKTAMSGMVGDIKGGIGNITGFIGKIGTAVVALTAIMAGGALFSGAIRSAKEFTEEVRKLSKALGIATGDATTLNIALHEVGMGADEYALSFRKLVQHVKENEAHLNKLGMTTRDSNGQMLNGQKLMESAITTLKGYKEGYDRTAAAADMFGMRINNLGGLMRLNSERMEHAAMIKEKLNLVMGDVESFHKYDAAMADVHLATMAVSGEITKAILPTLMDLSSFIINNVVPAVNALIRTFHILYGILEIMTIPLGLVISTLELLVDSFRVAGVVIYDVFTGRWGSIAKDADAAMKTLTKNVQENLKIIVKLAKDAGKDFQAGLTEGMRAPNKAVSPLSTGGKTYAGEGKGAKGGAEESRVSAWENEWKTSYVEAMNASGEFFNRSLEDERAFWEKKKALTSANSKERIEVERRIVDLSIGIYKETYSNEVSAMLAQEEQYRRGSQERIDIAYEVAEKIGNAYGFESKQYEDAMRHVVALEQERADELWRIQELQIERKQEYEASLVALEEERLKTEVALGNITVDDQLRSLMDLHAKSFAEDMRYYDEKLAAMREEGKQETSEYEKMLNDQAKLRQKHNLDMKKLNNDLAVSIHNQWQAFLAPIKDTIHGSIVAMIEGTMTLKDGLLNIFRSIVDTFIHAVVQKMVNEWIFGETIKFNWSQMFSGLMTALGITQATTETATEAGAAATSQAIRSATGVSAVTSYAAQGAAAAAASVAAIPYTGWAMAPEVMASTFAMIMSMAPVAAAAGGYDIPSGINPMVQAHAKEMILPANLADNIRNMTDNSSKRSNNVTFAPHVTAMDSKDVARAFKNSRSPLGKAIKELMRDGHIRTYR